MVLFIAGFTSCSRCSARSRRRSCSSSRARPGQIVAGVVVVADRRLLMIAYALAARADRRCTPSGGRSSRRSGRAWPGRSRSGWRSRPVGPRASARCSAASWPSPPQSARARGAFLLAVLLARARSAVPAARARRAVARRSFAWVRRHYRRSPRSRARSWSLVGVLLATGEFTRLLAPLLRYTPGLLRARAVASGRPMSHPAPADAAMTLAPDRRRFAWRTLRSMRTALILLMLLALASIGGSLLPQIPNSPERVASYLVDHPFFGELLPARGSVRRLRLVVVRPDHGAALHLAARVPAAAVARACSERSANARSRRESSTPSRSYRESTVAAAPDGRGDPARAGAAPAALPRGRATVSPVAAEKGMLREIGSLRLPLGVRPAPGWRDRGQGHRLHGRATSSRARPGPTPPPTTTGRSATGPLLLRRLLAVPASTSSTSRTLRPRPGSPMDFTSHVRLLDGDGRARRGRSA